MITLKGPGPGRYRLPPCCGYQLHDNTKFRGAAYSFGKRLDLSSMMHRIAQHAGTHNSAATINMYRQQQPLLLLLLCEFHFKTKSAYAHKKYHDCVNKERQHYISDDKK